ncbi:MAG: glycosyltransferase family 2 protein [Candidatus Cyclobacteriaceae bacterium M3_2C_046]
MQEKDKVSVIFTTYNSVDWLEKVLWGFANQQDRNFEIVVADDGSGAETREKIAQVGQAFKLDIKHVWQPDEGFQKSRILNKAIQASTTPYLIFTDGDCVPRKDFVAVHKKYSQPGFFLSGGYFKLPLTTSKRITQKDIFEGRAFEAEWLLANGLEWTYKLLKLTSSGWKEKALNRFTPAGAPWNGHNASGWKEDILAVNGYDERMQYGGQDRELGERLFNNGIKSKQIRYSAICIHLDHKRGYATPESIQKNLNIRKQTRNQRVTWTAYGIKKETTSSPA